MAWAVNNMNEYIVRGCISGKVACLHVKSPFDSVQTCKNTLNSLNARAIINIKYQPWLSGYINHPVATQGIKRMEEERETYIRLDFISLIAVLWGGLTPLKSETMDYFIWQLRVRSL